MAVDFAFFAWGGAIVTGTNDTMVINQTGVGDHTVTLTQTPTGEFPLWVPTGRGDGSDLLKMLEDRLKAAWDNTWVVKFEDATASQGISGKITISGAADFTIQWDDAAVTVDQSWFGARTSSIFTAQTADANTTQGTTNTSTYSSSLVWTPRVPTLSHDIITRPHMPAFQTTSMDRRNIVTSRLAAQFPTPTRIWSKLADSDNTGIGGMKEYSAELVRNQYVEVLDIDESVTNDPNASLVLFYEHATQGKWFLFSRTYDTVSSASVISEYGTSICRMNLDQASDWDSIVSRNPAPSPIMYDVSIPMYEVSGTDISATD